MIFHETMHICATSLGAYEWNSNNEIKVDKAQFSYLWSALEKKVFLLKSFYHSTEYMLLV